MASGAKDIQFLELKDTISQLNTTIKAQSDLIISLQKSLEERNANDDKKDRIIADLQAQLEYFKQKFFGSSSERRMDLPGQLTLFEPADDERIPVIIEPEIIEVQTHKRERKVKMTYEEQFENLPVEEVIVDTLSAEDKICSACGTEMVPIGHEKIRTELKFTPAKLVRIDYLATTYECPSCKNTEEPQFIKDEGVPL